MDLSLKFLGKNVRLVIKAKGFVLFWMVEHEMLLEGKVLSAKVSKVRSCKWTEQLS